MTAVRRSFCPLLLSSLLLASAQNPGQAPSAAPVEVEVVEERDLAPTRFFLGSAEPKRRSLVAAAIEGYVVEYLTDEGRSVGEGEVLARLRDSELRLQLLESEAALEEFRERHRRALKDLERARELIEKDAKTQKELDLAIEEERTSALRIPQAEARLEILKADIDKKVITAPFAGQIVEEHIEVGEWIPRGGTIASLVDVSSVYVRVNVPEDYIRFIREGQTARVEISAAAKAPYQGKIISITVEGDPLARTFPVRVEIPNDGAIRAGMSALVEIPTGPGGKRLVVSKDAVILDGARRLVYVVSADQHAEERTVRLDDSSGGQFVVVEGLQAGDRVVIRGNERLRAGMPLRILPRREGNPD